MEENQQANSSGTERSRRRTTAEAMATKQRDISVSEFFAKNRHLLGFDNPRKALLTAVKEAVDNSLDACEEAGIVPEIWVHLETTAANRYKIGVQDNGPGIVKKQIPLIFGKLLYGSKFHRLRMSRGQQGIGISAAGMYGMLTTGKPVKILSMTSEKKPSHYFEIQIDTKRNQPEIINGRGEGEEIPAGEKGRQHITDHGIEWASHYPPAADATPEEAAKPRGLHSGTRVTIELEGRYQRGRGSVDEYLEQTAIANPHVTIHYIDPDSNGRTFWRSTTQLPAEPEEIKPHPYGIELGQLVTMLKDFGGGTMAQFLSSSFSRVSPAVAQTICKTAKIGTRAQPKRIGRQEADALYQAIQNTKIPAPSTDCISPIGEPLILKGLHQQVPGEFFCAATRPPAVYRGNPFLIEVGLAYGASSPTQKVTLDALTELLAESDARSVRQFLLTTFDGLGPSGVERILSEARMGSRQTAAKLDGDTIARLHAAMKNVNLSEGQVMQVLRYANRVPLLFQPAACAITQSVIGNNWRSYGLSQSRGQLPTGPVTLMVHMASVWVPFTSESKEADRLLSRNHERAPAWFAGRRA
jgi:DNA topoisomerase-6 subunit B